VSNAVSRRSFFVGGAMSAAGAMSMPESAGAESRTKQVEFCCGAQADPDRAMNPIEYRQAMRLVKKTGYAYVEYPHLSHLSADDARELKAYTQEVGLKPLVTHSMVVVKESPQWQRKYRKDQPICCRNAEILGVKVIVDHVAPGGQKEEKLARDVARLKESAKVAADHGLELAVENIKDLSPAYCRRVVDAIDLPHVGCCCDTGHAMVWGAKPQDAIRVMGSKLINTHLQDGFGELDDHLPPGVGIADWAEIVNALREVKFNRPWMLEIVGRKDGRKIPELRDFGLEKAMVLGISYLKYFAERG